MNIYQHFRQDEQPFIDQVLSWINQVEKTYQIKLTDFLNPREQHIIDMLAGTSLDDLNIYKHGGSEQSERKRVIIAPQYETVSESDFQLSLLQGTYHSKFVNLKHKDVMGAFLSLGIKRQKLGDILVEDGLIQIITSETMASFVLVNLTQVKHTNVKLSEMPLSSLKEKHDIWETTDYVVTSLRLDAIIKMIYHLSRKQAAEMIAKGYVKVNYQVIDDRKSILDVGDMISIKGKGRSKIVSINSRTKKDKFNITTSQLQ